MFNSAVRNRALVRKFRDYFRKTGEEDRKILQIEKQTENRDEERQMRFLRYLSSRLMRFAQPH